MADAPDNVPLGRLLAEARRARGLSLRELGSRLTAAGRRPQGISAQYLNDLEHDRRRPSPTLAAELAALLGLSPAWLEAAAGRGAAPVTEYLLERPEAADPVGRLFRRAREAGWTVEDWTRLLRAAEPAPVEGGVAAPGPTAAGPRRRPPRGGRP